MYYVLTDDFTLSDSESNDKDDAGMKVYLSDHAMQTVDMYISGELLCLKLTMLIQKESILKAVIDVVRRYK